jgi:hypothetical protein
MAPAAHAAVTYTFTGQQTLNLGPVDPDDPDGPQNQVLVNMSFTLVRPTFITNGAFTPDSCTDDNAYFTCGTMEFDNTPNQFNVGGDFISFGYSYDDGNIAFGGGSFYFFQPGAFAAVGSYTNDGWPINGPPIAPEPNGYDCCFGNAGPARLEVSGSPDTAVPEPGAWALMILGFAGAGSVLRRHRARARMAPA